MRRGRFEPRPLARAFANEQEADEGRFTDPHRINPQVPLALTRIVQQSLSVDRDQRYADAGEMLGSLMQPTVSHSWVAISDPAVVERWGATTADGRFELCVRERPRSGFEVTVTRDRGSGPRHVVKKRASSRADALRVRRNCLLALVSNGTVA